MIPSSAEKTLLRTRPQSTKLWLSVYEPEVALAARVQATVPVPSMECNYDTVTEGSYLNVEPGMTMYIGSSAGASDIGKIRVKSIDGSIITTAENSEFSWTAGDYITIVRFFEINAVFPRITLQRIDPNPDYTLWYKDYDITYTWQNDVLGTFICMGSHYAGFLENGTCQVYYSASGTTNLVGQTITYDWWFEGATVTGSSNHTPGLISYNTAGHYTTRLQITTASGTYDTSYRHISIYNRPDQGPTTPILRWNLKSLSGSRDSGGYTARIAVYEDFSSIKDGSLVVIFADDYYGTTKQSIGNTLNRGSIVFVGYIMDGSITINYETSAMEFTVGSPTEIMKQIESFAVGVNSSSDPANEPNVNENIPSSWAVVKNMDCRRAIYHYLRWHSTALMCNDFEFSGTDQNIEYFDADRESIYSAVQTLMDGTLAGDFVCSRDGKMWSEVGARATNNAATAFDTNITLDNYDWRGNARIEEITTKKVSFLEMGGIYFAGPGFGSVPYLASAPGSSPAYRGFNQKLSGLALGSSQADLNILVGNVFAWMNSQYPSVRLDLSGNYRNLDIAPIEIVKLNMASSDNIRGISWSNKSFIVSGMDFGYDPEGELFLPSIDLHEVTQGIAGATITIPEVPPTAGGEETGGGFNIPSITIPPFPPISIPTINIGGSSTYYPLFVPAQAFYYTDAPWDGSTDYVPLKSYNTAEGPAVAYPLTTNSAQIYGSFVVPNGYAGSITVYLVYNNNFTGNADVETYYKPWTKGASGWAAEPGEDVYTDWNPTAVVTNALFKPGFQVSVNVTSLGLVTLWSKFSAATSGGPAFYMAGWYIQYG